MAHAKTAAARPRSTVDQLLRQFAYARLLARLFVLAPDNWVLKGATGLVVRLPNARRSLDVDLGGPHQARGGRLASIYRGEAATDADERRLPNRPATAGSPVRPRRGYRAATATPP